jgi:hypothetical protein
VIGGLGVIWGVIWGEIWGGGDLGCDLGGDLVLSSFVLFHYMYNVSCETQ